MAFTYYIFTDTLQKKCSKNFAKFLVSHICWSHCFVMQLLCKDKGNCCNRFQNTSGITKKGKVFYGKVIVKWSKICKFNTSASCPFYPTSNIYTFHWCGRKSFYRNLICIEILCSCNLKWCSCTLTALASHKCSHVVMGEICKTHGHTFNKRVSISRKHFMITKNLSQSKKNRRRRSKHAFLKNTQQTSF